MRADPRQLHLAAFHPTGSARAGADAARHPVDQHGRLRGVEGVWLCDASVLPSCPTVNPQVSIMAVALHISDTALAGGRSQPALSGDGDALPPPRCASELAGERRGDRSPGRPVPSGRVVAPGAQPPR